MNNDIQEICGILNTVSEVQKRTGASTGDILQAMKNMYLNRLHSELSDVVVSVKLEE